MSETVDRGSPGGAPGASACVDDFGLSAMRSALVQAARAVPDALDRVAQIDVIAGLESVKNALDALQAEVVLSFARAEAAERTRNETVEPEKLERGIAAQVGLACRTSIGDARKRVRMARDLHDGLDHLRGLFAAGEVSACKVATVVAAASHLDADERADLDRQLAARDVAHRGIGSIRLLARRLAAEIAPEKFLQRCAAARSGRRVTLRPAADGMTDLVAHLPVEQGVACLAALRKAFVDVQANPAPLTRGRGQVMADTLVERLTGQVRATDIDLAVQVLVPVEVLVDPGCPLPVEIPGHGPVPFDLLATAAGRAAWRKLVTRDGVVIGGDSTSRRFSGVLAELIRARDQSRCTEPYCDAPAREIDHIVRRADGGRTAFANGRSVCRLHNLLREESGWSVDHTEVGIVTTTPTGHRYTRRAAGPDARGGGGP